MLYQVRIFLLFAVYNYSSLYIDTLSLLFSYIYIDSTKVTRQKRTGAKIKIKKNELIDIFVSIKMPHAGVLHGKVSGDSFGTSTFVAVTEGLVE